MSDGIAAAVVVHVVAHIGSDEVVARHRVCREIVRQLRKGPDVRDALRRRSGEVVGLVVEIDERVVVGLVKLISVGVLAPWFVSGQLVALMYSS